MVYGGDVVVLDVGQLAVEVIAGMRAWFQDLQMDSARVSNVAAHLKKLVIVTDQELQASAACRSAVRTPLLG